MAAKIKNGSWGNEVRRARGKGRGVFATRAFASGELIEIAPYLFLSARDYRIVSETDLVQFIFDAGQRAAALGLGFASLYNHSDTPNASYTLSRSQQTITFKALEPIAPREEITVDYGYHPAIPSTWPEEYADCMRRAKNRKRRAKK